MPKILAKKVKRLGHLLTDDNMMNLQLVLHDVGNLSSKAQADVFQAWQVGLLSPLDRFFSTFDEQLAPTYRVRDVTLYFLTVLAAYLQPTVGTGRGTLFKINCRLIALCRCFVPVFCGPKPMGRIRGLKHRVGCCRHGTNGSSKIKAPFLRSI